MRYVALALFRSPQRKAGAIGSISRAESFTKFDEVKNYRLDCAELSEGIAST